jgi:hypothetical protein
VLKCRQSTYRLRKEIIDKKASTLINGRPILKVDRSCKIVIDGFLGGYHFPERSTGQAASDGFDKPFRDGYYEHVMNTVEYFAINMFKPIDVKPRRQENIPRGLKDKIHGNTSQNAGFSYAD